MITSGQAFNKFGQPGTARESQYMVLWTVPKNLAVGKIPKRIYVNKALKPVLEAALTNVVERGLVDCIHSWDGCHAIRKMRRAGAVQSLHSWGLAVDINAAENPMGHPSQQDPRLVKAFMDTGMIDWGGDWHTRKDAMHFQLKSL